MTEKRKECFLLFKSLEKKPVRPGGNAQLESKKVPGDRGHPHWWPQNWKSKCFFLSCCSQTIYWSYIPAKSNFIPSAFHVTLSSSNSTAFVVDCWFCGEALTGLPSPSFYSVVWFHWFYKVNSLETSWGAPEKTSSLLSHSLKMTVIKILININICTMVYDRF